MGLSNPHAMVDRRNFLAGAGGGIGALAFSSILASDATAAAPLAPHPPHFAPRAKRVLWLFMHGGPSHMDLWDPKPDLVRYAGKPLPQSFGKVMTRRKVSRNPLLGPVKPFRPHGQSGLEISEFLPHMAQHADDLDRGSGQPDLRQRLVRTHPGGTRYARHPGHRERW